MRRLSQVESVEVMDFDGFLDMAEDPDAGAAVKYSIEVTRSSPPSSTLHSCLVMLTTPSPTEAHQMLASLKVAYVPHFSKKQALPSFWKELSNRNFESDFKALLKLSNTKLTPGSKLGWDYEDVRLVDSISSLPRSDREAALRVPNLQLRVEDGKPNFDRVRVNSFLLHSCIDQIGSLLVAPPHDEPILYNDLRQDLSLHASALHPSLFPENIPTASADSSHCRRTMTRTSTLLSALLNG